MTDAESPAKGRDAAAGFYGSLECFFHAPHLATIRFDCNIFFLDAACYPWLQCQT